MAQVVVDDEKIETLNEPISASDFYANYVSQRKPVKFDFIFDEFVDAMTKWKDDNYLISAAGKEIVCCEVRASKAEQFGIGNKVRMKFADFLSELSENEMQYLTVQEIGINDDGQPQSVYSSPLNDELFKDIPFKPAIAKNLELHQINVWIGHSVNGSSSKLHHDYHDNFYFVFRGNKCFQILPPKCAHSLYLNGNDQIVRICENGLIAYSDEYREDGANKQSVSEWQLAANDIDKYLEQLLDNANESEPPLKKQKINKREDPLSFSRIDLSKDDDDILIKEYPQYAKVRHLKQTINISEGQMLYLPCGWFHNVTSTSNKKLKSHFALNYWMHPPIKNGTFKQPYPDNFWKEYNQNLFNL